MKKLEPFKYDITSKSGIEQIAIMNEKIERLIKSTTKTLEKRNQEYIEFKDVINEMFKNLSNCITHCMESYIKSVDIKFEREKTNLYKLFDEKIEEINNMMINVIYYGENIFVGSSGAYLTEGGSKAFENGKEYTVIVDGVEYVTNGNSSGGLSFNTEKGNIMIMLYSGTDKLWLYSDGYMGQTIATLEIKTMR